MKLKIRFINRNKKTSMIPTSLKKTSPLINIEFLSLTYCFKCQLTVTKCEFNRKIKEKDFRHDPDHSDWKNKNSFSNNFKQLCFSMLCNDFQTSSAWLKRKKFEGESLNRTPYSTTANADLFGRYAGVDDVNGGIPLGLLPLTILLSVLLVQVQLGRRLGKLSKRLASLEGKIFNKKKW